MNLDTTVWFRDIWVSAGSPHIFLTLWCNVYQSVVILQHWIEERKSHQPPPHLQNIEILLLLDAFNRTITMRNFLFTNKNLFYLHKLPCAPWPSGPLRPTACRDAYFQSWYRDILFLFIHLINGAYTIVLFGWLYNHIHTLHRIDIV